MRLTIQVSNELSPSLIQGEPTNLETRELLRLGESLGISFQPVHPGTRDPQLATYFTVEVPDMQVAQDVLARLQEHKAVKAAYVKPPDELP